MLNYTCWAWIVDCSTLKVGNWTFHPSSVRPRTFHPQDISPLDYSTFPAYAFNTQASLFGCFNYSLRNVHMSCWIKRLVTYLLTYQGAKRLRGKTSRGWTDEGGETSINRTVVPCSSSLLRLYLLHSIFSAYSRDRRTLCLYTAELLGAHVGMVLDWHVVALRSTDHGSIPVCDQVSYNFNYWQQKQLVQLV